MGAKKQLKLIAKHLSEREITEEAARVLAERLKLRKVTWSRGKADLKGLVPASEIVRADVTALALPLDQFSLAHIWPRMCNLAIAIPEGSEIEFDAGAPKGDIPLVSRSWTAAVNAAANNEFVVLLSLCYRIVTAEEKANGRRGKAGKASSSDPNQVSGNGTGAGSTPSAAAQSIASTIAQQNAGKAAAARASGTPVASGLNAFGGSQAQWGNYLAQQASLAAQMQAMWPGSSMPAGPMPRVWIDEAKPSLGPAELKVGEIIGYRVWRIDKSGYLWSGAADVMWTPGVPMTNKVGSSALGIHAFKAMDEKVQRAAQEYSSYGGRGSYIGMAIGTVALWGEVIEHEKGYTAEYAMVDSIESVTGVPLSDRRAILENLRAAYCGGPPATQPLPPPADPQAEADRMDAETAQKLAQWYAEAQQNAAAAVAAGGPLSLLEPAPRHSWVPYIPLAMAAGASVIWLLK